MGDGLSQYAVRKHGQTEVEYRTGVFPADALPDDGGPGVYEVGDRGARLTYLFEVSVSPDGTRRITQIG